VFHIHLLGHDSVAGHEVEFTRQDTGGHRIAWTGRIALTYVGDEEFRYGFRADIQDVTLRHISVPDEMPIDEARRHLLRLVDVPQRFTAATVDGQRVLAFAEPYRRPSRAIRARHCQRAAKGARSCRVIRAVRDATPGLAPVPDGRAR
jgi:hypothetical protein